MRAVVRPPVTLLALSALAACGPLAAPAAAQDLSSAEVKRSIERGRDALVKLQGADGSWGLGERAGKDALALLALLNSGMTVGDPPVDAALRHLRDLPKGKVSQTYDAALVLMALAAAKDGRRDRARMLDLVRLLEAGRGRAGNGRGGWSYGLGRGGPNISPDRSNSQYAVLALREAAYAGIPVAEETWEDVAVYWAGGPDGRGGRVRAQNGDGGWGYGTAGQGGSRGSMTVAGIASVAILKTVLKEDPVKNGVIDCCAPDPVEAALDRAQKAGEEWLAARFSVTRNPGHREWVLYYLYGLERAGRLAGERFFGEHDWYREGAAFLIRGQSKRDGTWRGNGHGETEPIVATSFALLFLSKGLSPVLINKLDYGGGRGRAGDAWKEHPGDARNLTFHVSGLPKWPKLVTWQVLDLEKAVRAGDLAGALQGPVTLMTGREFPRLSETDIAFLRDYVDAGGFLLGVQNCGGDDFAQGFRAMVKAMYPDDPPPLDRLTADHPVFRSEYLLDADTVELFGADLGCRTPIMLSEVDLSCYWDLWTPNPPRDRDPGVAAQITQKVQTGVNILAYATGREPPDKLERTERQVEAGARDEIERGLLQVAKLRHEGEWDAAPRALRNLLLALNTTAGVAASTKTKTLVPGDANVFRYPVLYMHGRGAFTLGQQEKDRLRTYLENGGVLFADACCGSDPFDRAFRRELADVLPEGATLERLPPDHELFTEGIGFDLSRVRRRVPGGGAAGGLDADVVVGEPFLEAATVNGQIAVIYSKYDISCALERQTTVACAGYLPEDALKIGINVLRYALLRDPVAAEAATR